MVEAISLLSTSLSSINSIIILSQYPWETLMYEMTAQ